MVARSSLKFMKDGLLFLAITHPASHCLDGHRILCFLEHPSSLNGKEQISFPIHSMAKLIMLISPHNKTSPSVLPIHEGNAFSKCFQQAHDKLFSSVTGSNVRIFCLIFITNNLVHSVLYHYSLIFLVSV